MEQATAQEVSREQYGAAVIAAIKMARQSGTSSGSIAAQALLSAYNGSEFQLNIAGLGLLDRENYEVVLAVIRGRYDTGTEPHTLIKNGSSIFTELWNDYRQLHVEERGKMSCPDCYGLGKQYRDDDDQVGVKCSRCDGSGRVCRCWMMK